MESDSDDDIVTNNVFIFQPNTTISAKGPNITKSLSFRNHMSASINHMPRNIKMSGYASSLYDQRSIHSRRDVSPMSFRSAYDFQPRNFNMSHYPRGMSSQRSVLNGRNRSPMSMSMASTTSVSAVDIVMAFKNGQFSKHDWNLISDAYEKFKKLQKRNKSEKRRRLRKFLKGARRRSGGESGEQGSESSISDFDDTRSKRTSILKKNISRCRSTRTDLSEKSLINIRRRVSSQKSNIYSHCSATPKQKSFKNMFSIDSSSNRNELQNIALQRDRLNSGFLLPSQRFNKSVASSTIPENTDKQQRNTYQVSTKENFCTQDKRSNNSMSTTDNELEEAFAIPPMREKGLDLQRKRSLEKDDQTYMPNKKRNKLSPIKKLSHNCLSENRNTKQSDLNKDDFVFAKPSLPIKKKIIAESPLVKNIFEKKDVEKQNHVLNAQNTLIVQEKEQVQSKEILETTNHSNNDVSTRPSFIKRKLFTQKMDVAENKILSSDNENSPKTIYSGIQKEKNKARKLVTNQSCLRRDVLEDENYLDLIHKIVPPDQMNSTSQPNKSDNQRKSNDKWEATSVTLTFNNDSLSDTYTDEDIFHDNTNTKNSKKDQKSKTTAAHTKIQKDCKVVCERMPHKNPQHKNEIKIPTQHEPSSVVNVDKNKIIKTCVKSFWDIDSESDFECQVKNKKNNSFNEPPVKGTNFSVGDRQANKLEPTQISAKASNISLLNNTKPTDNKFKNTCISIRSHRAPKKKCREEIDQSNTTLNQTQSQNLRLNDMSCVSYTAFVNNVKSNNAVKALPENKSVNSRAIRSCRTPKEKANGITKNETKTERNRNLRQTKADLSSSTLDVKVTSKGKSKNQNMNNSKQSNHNKNKQTENIKSTIISRKSDISFSLTSDIKPAKTQKMPVKNREYKLRRSNVSFSISSDSPLTRSRAAKLRNESQFKRNKTKFNNEIENIPPLMEIRTTPNKKSRKNGIFDIVQDLKSNKNKSIRKR